jgi:hypothetical protein
VTLSLIAFVGERLDLLAQLSEARSANGLRVVRHRRRLRTAKGGAVDQSFIDPPWLWLLTSLPKLTSHWRLRHGATPSLDIVTLARGSASRCALVVRTVYFDHVFRKSVGVNPVRRRNADEKWLLPENPNRSAMCSIGNSR